MGLSLTETEKQLITIKLASPMSTSFQVISPEGKPVVGAEVTRLECSSSSTGATILQPRSLRNHDAK